MWPILSKWDTVHKDKFEFLVYYLCTCFPIYNGGRNFEIGQSLVKLCPFNLSGIEKYEMEKSTSKFWVSHWVYCQLIQKSSKLHQLCFKCWSKAFTVHLKHTHEQLWFCKNLIIKNLPQVFSAISPFEVLHRNVSFQ